jgi:hypothetical protein
VKDTVGILLREAWKQKEKSDCQHPELSKERSYSGVVTGVYLCTTCGHVMRMERVQAEVTRMAQIL